MRTLAVAAALLLAGACGDPSRPVVTPTARYATAAVAVDDIVYVADGLERGPDGDTVVATMHAYAPAGGRWYGCAPMPTARAFAAAAELDGRIYVFGGRTRDIPPTEMLDLDDLDAGWQKRAPLPVHVCRFALAAWSGRLLAIGGETDRGAEINTTVYEYTPATDTWCAHN